MQLRCCNQGVEMNIVELHVNDLLNIPACLRKLADRIESGDLTE